MDTYTLYDLIYEYHDKVERIIASEEVFELNADKIEEGQEKETLDWVLEEERKDLEKAEAAKAKKETEDEKWMLQQLKEEFGDDFGDDISTDFEG